MSDGVGPQVSRRIGVVHPHAVRRVLPGVLLVAVIAAAATGISSGLGTISPLLWAMAIGVCVAPWAGRAPALAPGVRFSATQVLRAGIALVGLRVSLSDLASIGLQGLIVVIGALGATFAVTLWAGRRLGVSPGLTMLIATGTAICGASAIAAISSVIEAEEEEVAYAVATVTILGTIAMVALPPLCSVLGLGDRESGLWIGASVHEVAQVAAAGAAVSAFALALATAVKMARVVLLAPLVAVVGYRRPGVKGRRVTVPWFVVGFIVFVCIRSAADLSPTTLRTVGDVSTTLLAAGLGALGLGIQLGPLRAEGVRPLLLGITAGLTASGSALLLTVIA